MSEAFSIEESVLDELLEAEDIEQKQQKTQQLKKQKFNNDLITVLETEAGRNVLWSFMEKLGLLQEPFCGENTNASNFAMGRCSAARVILGDILAASPKAYMKMMDERLTAETVQEKKQHA